MVIVFRGGSGAGKSTLKELLKSTDFKFGEFDAASRPAINYCKSIWGSYVNKEHKLYDVSADDYFMVEGEYKFDPKMLGTAHAACLRHFNEVVTDPNNIIIVDNTNCSISEFVPYAALANAYAHELHIITLLVDPLRAYERNKHNVPMTNIIKQDLTLRQSVLEMPPWYPQQVFINY